ncbi:MAG TPA: molybdopterin-dependent oxidoreductase [Thermoanaerobaculia bacterium]|nr:molybdopterin-dependent oxidoreductase [Thermoanaerobaculia bacterium]
MAIQFVKGCCPLDCQDTCAWVARVEHGRVTRVEGAKDHPFTRGTLCAKVNDYQTRTYAPDRLLHPLRRIGPKGAGTFEQITWDEALNTIAARFQQVIATHGAEALLYQNYLGSMGIVQRRALMRLFHLLGSSRQSGSICGASGNVVEAEGHPRGFDPEEIAHSRFVVIWGANLLTTSHHHWYFVEQARRRNGAKLICIDPRRTRTAEQCDEHLPIRPGTDAILAASIAHTVLTEGLADVEFATAAVGDLEEYRREVATWPAERAAERCGISAAEIRALATRLATVHPAVIRSGIAPQQTASGDAFVRGLSALVILTGQWRHRGGGLFLEANPILNELRAARPDLIPGNPRRLDMGRLGATLTDAALDPPVKALMIWGHNPAVVLPDASRVREGLAREDLFTVVIEHFMTDTARYADVVLPSTTQLEHFDIVGAWGHHYVSVNHAAIAPLGEAKSHGEVMRLLAKKMRIDHPALQESDEEIARSALPEGVDYEDLAERGWVKTSPARPSFASPVSLSSGELADSPAPNGKLRLLTPKSHYFLNSSFANMPRHRKSMVRPTLEMHSSDAASRSLTDGDKVIVGNERGSLEVWLRVSDAIRPGVASLPGKWWTEPHETNALANRLTPSEYTPGGQPAYNDTFVEVSRSPSGP